MEKAWLEVCGDYTRWLTQWFGSLVFARREQMQSALLPSLSLHGHLCNKNHHLFFCVMAEIDLKRVLCKEDCQGPAYTNSLWMPWPPSTCWPVSCTWAQAMTWIMLQVCSALLTCLWTCLMTMDSSGDHWTLGWTWWLSLTASSCPAWVLLLRMLPVLEEEGGWTPHAWWVKATPAYWSP